MDAQVISGLSLDNEQPSSDPIIGKVISERYRVLERIGRGGFGAVYKVQHIRLDKTLALKVLFEHSHQNPRMIKRFEREARATCRIGHDNIVEITDFARDRRVGYYFVMEYLEGETLCDRLRKLGPMSSPKIIHVSCQITDALAATHGKGIVHRDLKPDNVFLVRKRGEEDFVKILDFGIAAMGDLEEDVPRLTRHGMMLGTPAYMSPEQAEGRSADQRSDVYSLGILLYEMTTGSVPFKNASSLAVLEMHRTTKPVPPRAARPDLKIPPALEQVILRALRKPNTERYQNMREMYNDLVDISQQIDMSSVIARRPELRVDSPLTPAGSREPEEPQWIDEDLVLLDDLSPVPESVTIRNAEGPEVTEETPMHTSEAMMMDDTAPSAAVPARPPPIPPELEERPTVLDGPAYEITATEAIPLDTLQIRTDVPARDFQPREPRQSVWQSPTVLVLSGFLITLLLYSIIASLTQKDSRQRMISPRDIPSQSRSTKAPAETATPAKADGKAPSKVGSAPAEAVGDKAARRPPQAEESQTPGSSTIETQPAETGVLVKVQVQSQPAGARVVWNGKTMGTTPITLEMPKGDKAQVLAVSLRGYLGKRRRVVPDHDTTLVVKLAKSRKAGKYRMWEKTKEADDDSYDLY
jgi:serine/threonine protein kinase